MSDTTTSLSRLPKWLIPVAFVLAALALYWPTRQAGFVMDWLGWQYAYNRDGWAGIPGSFGYPGLQPVLHLGNYLLYWLFGANSPVWYLVFAALHGANAWLLYRLALRLPLGIAPGEAQFIALSASALFLLSPYAAEVVVWRVCLHYLLALFFALLAMHRSIDYLDSQQRRHWWQLQLFFGLALFAFEWSLIIPLLLVSLAWCWLFFQKKPSLLPALARLCWPQALLWVLYFGINKIRLGDWVGHYGAATHLHIQPKVMLATMFKYLIKQFGFARHWEHGLKTQVFDGLDGGNYFWLALGVVAVLAVVWLLLLRRAPGRLRWAGLSFGWFFIALLPVSNLFFCYLLFSENDRYGYFATGFGWLGLVLLLSFLPKMVSRGLAIGLVGLSFCFLFEINQYWAKSEQLYDDLVQDFHWYDRDEVLILASPDNYMGVFMFRIIGQDNGFNEALELRRGQKYQGRMWEAAQFNVLQPTDGVKVEPDSSGMLYKFSFRQDGNWWWRNGIGAIDYENDRFLFRKKEWHSEVEFKNSHPNTTILYPVGNQWFEIK
ncbi:MAG: hypothetical protein IT260_09235 [Saprospiraceae bacterium]|nr:hypothetical protein [Saprospiraceae bacterium]